MRDSKRMQVINRSKNLMGDLFGPALRYFKIVFLEATEKVSSLYIFGHKVDNFKSFKDIIKFNYVGVLAIFEYLNLPSDHLVFFQG